MTQTATVTGVSKRRADTPPPKPDSEPEPEKVVLYLEVEPALKEVMGKLAKRHNRKLVGECVQALQEYAARFGLGPLAPHPESD